MPRESTPNVSRAREHLGRVDQLLAVAATPPSSPAAPPATTRPAAPMHLVRQ